MNLHKTFVIITACFLSILSIIIWWRAPIIGEEWNKQTLYVGLLNIWYGNSNDSIAHAMWIDDDSTEGVLIVKKISDETGVYPCFAVIADKMTTAVADSLALWQQQGFGIIIHGFRHERWLDWNQYRIKQDIKKSYKRLAEQGFDTTKILKFIIPPHGCNTSNIRQTICKQGCQMISGANLVNPNRYVFQLGRIDITTETDIAAMRHLLKKAYKKRGFVIFCTHSSMPASFSEEKTRQIIEMAKEIGFDFNFYD